MRAFGGILWKDAARPADTSVALAMARRLEPGVEPAVLAAGPLALFAVGPGSVLRRAAHGLVAGDLDVLNAASLSSSEAPERPEEALWSLCEREGAAGLARVRGSFALAHWSERERRLLLAADHFGTRRLYYVETPDALAFASRSSALLAAGGGLFPVDPTSAYLYLNYAFVPAPRSIFAGVRRLPPGHAVILGGDMPTPLPYWDVAYRERPWRLEEAAATLFRLTAEAVAAALAGEGPKETGAFLSGGTDSSTVLGLMGRATGERANAFSIGFREGRYDELGYADLAARHFGAAHYTAVLTPDEALAELPRLVAAYDEPFGNASEIATYFCCRLAREAGVTRLLAGDGGDEILGGNERYRTHQVFAAYHLLPRWVRRGLVEPLLSRLPEGGGSPVGKAQRYVRRANIPNPERFHFYEFYAAREATGLLAADYLDTVDVDAPWRLAREHFERAPADSELNRLLYLDMKLAIGDNDLLKVTRAAELAGVGVRFPMLDLPLVEHAATLPARYKVRGLEKRYLFKRAFAELLPAETLAKKKHGFGLPIGEWIRSHAGFRELARDALLGPGARTRHYFRAGALDRLFDRHEREAAPYYGDVLWVFLALELWHREQARRRS
jgi:asparagine synthase (glutamine-hydrolysing)